MDQIGLKIDEIGIKIDKVLKVVFLEIFFLTELGGTPLYRNNLPKGFERLPMRKLSYVRNADLVKSVGGAQFIN